MFTWKSQAGLKVHFGQNDRYEIHTVLSFILPQFMWIQVKSRLNTEEGFSTEMKSHTGLSSFRLSCERTPGSSITQNVTSWNRCHRKYLLTKIGTLWSLFHRATWLSGFSFLVYKNSLALLLLKKSLLPHWK